MDRSVNAAAAKQTLIGGIDDRIDRKRRYIASGDLYSVLFQRDSPARIRFNRKSGRIKRNFSTKRVKMGRRKSPGKITEASFPVMPSDGAGFT